MTHHEVTTKAGAQEYLNWCWLNGLLHDPLDDVRKDFIWGKETPHERLVKQMYLRDSEIMGIENFDPHEYMLDNLVKIDMQSLLTTVAAITHNRFEEIRNSRFAEGTISTFDFTPMLAIRFEVKYAKKDYLFWEEFPWEDELCNFVDEQLKL